MNLSRGLSARLAAHTVVRVLALLGLEHLLMGTSLDGVLRAVGLYSDDPLGAGFTAFFVLMVVSGVLGLADGLLRLRRTPVAAPFVLWALVSVVYGAASSSLTGSSSGVGDWVFVAVLMGGLVALGAGVGVAVGAALRVAVTPAAARPTPGRST